MNATHNAIADHQSHRGKPMSMSIPMPMPTFCTQMKPRLNRALLAVVLLSCSIAHADVPQHLSAKVDGRSFESDDAGILYLLPAKGTLNLIAATKGASAYPPPKELADKLSINCRNFDGKPRKYTARDFGSHGCEVKFIKGESRKPFGDPVAEYKLADGNNAFEVTTVNGKVIEGKFSFTLVEVKTKAKLTISDGTFKAEDRQK